MLGLCSTTRAQSDSNPQRTRKEEINKSREDIEVFGAPWCPDCRRSKRFLESHKIPYRWINIDEDDAALRYVEQVQGGKRIIPMIVLGDGRMLFEPSDHDLAQALGVRIEASSAAYDLVVVGGGPAGLTAAMYAAREGIDTIVVEKSALGGQAAVTERIDNYPGFPEGIGGVDLTERFTEQARRLGVELLPSTSVSKLSKADGDISLELSNGQELRSHAVILAVGSRYRRLQVPGEERLIGSGVHFCATCDAPFYKGTANVVVVGGGNSGFEESFFLLRFAQRVTILERGCKPKASKLLQEKAEADPRITVLTDTEVLELKGGQHLEEVVVRNAVSGEVRYLKTPAVFVFIGLAPNTSFLKGVVNLDDQEFIVTGPTLQTSMEEVFAAGDARQGSTKQVASAVGEGATALLMVREYLQRHNHIPAKHA